MATSIRASISKRNKYYISKHRYYELKHFCLQYPEWVSKYNYIFEKSINSVVSADLSEVKTKEYEDKMADYAAEMADIRSKIDMVKDTAIESDPSIGTYILMAVAYGKSFNYLKTVKDIPCERDMFYDRYRRFFYLLDSRKNHRLL